MTTNTTKNPTRITFGRLSATLSQIGFVRKETEDFIAYRQSAHDALIVLPKWGVNSIVDDSHLVTVRNTITGKGVASLDKFQAMLSDPFVEATLGKQKSHQLGKAAHKRKHPPMRVKVGNSSAGKPSLPAFNE